MPTVHTRLLRLLLLSILSFRVHAGDEAPRTADLLRHDLSVLLPQRLTDAGICWGLESVQPWGGLVRVTLFPYADPRDLYSRYLLSVSIIDVQFVGSQSRAMEALRTTRQSISAGPGGTLQDLGDQCYFWTRTPERGGSVIRLASGPYIVAVIAPTLADAVALTRVTIPLLRGLTDPRPE